jgi:hypothetical protein
LTLALASLTDHLYFELSTFTRDVHRSFVGLTQSLAMTDAELTQVTMLFCSSTRIVERFVAEAKNHQRFIRIPDYLLTSINSFSGAHIRPAHAAHHPCSAGPSERNHVSSSILHSLLTEVDFSRNPFACFAERCHCFHQQIVRRMMCDV